MVKGFIRRAGVVLALVAILSTYGGHWGLLQTIAWSGMLVNYSRDAGLVQGIQETFDGDHPCSLCIRISEVREQTEPATELAVPSSQPTMRHFASSTTVLTPRSQYSTTTFHFDFIDPDHPHDSPPTPPPRVPA